MKFFLILFLSTCLAQNNGFIINQIQIDGNDIISDDNIKFISGLEEGMYVNNFKIQNSIKRLWDTKRYEHIDIRLEKSFLNNKIIIIVKESFFINDITFEGNKKISDKKILEELEIKKGEIFNNQKMLESLNSIKKMYKSKNYHNIKVEFTTSELDDNKKNIFISIDEKKRTKLKKIFIFGNENFSDKKLLKNFQSTKVSKWFLPMTWGSKFDEDKYFIDKKILENFYYTYGYKDFQIISDSIDYKNDEILIYLNIKEGNPYYIRNLSWDGNSIKSDSILTSISGIKKGSLYNKQDFELNTVDAVRSLYMNEGFLNFNIQPVIKPVPKQDSLDVKFIISENEIFKVNSIIITGNKKTDESVIRRELDIYPGQTFNRNKLYQSVTDLYMLNFFGDVVPKVNPISENEINLEIEVLEKSVGTANFSMGYNQVHGLQGGGGFEFPNFRGKGQTMSISYQRGLGNNYNSNNLYQINSNSSVSQYESFSISFFDPSIFDTPNSFGVSVSHSERGRNQNSLWPFDTNTSRFSIRYGRRKLNWPDRYFKISWGYSFSRDRYFSENRDLLIDYWSRTNNNIDSYIKEDGDLYYFNTSGISLSQTINRDSRNRPEFPTRGSRLSFSTVLAGSFLGGNHDYLKNSFEINSFSSLTEKIIVSQLFKVGSLEYLENSNANSVIPISARYFMGGAGMSYGEMLRGYRENSIGPYQSGPTGGNLMMKYSLEVRFLFSDDPTVYGFLFADMGNIWSDYDVAKLTDLKRSLGIGIRLHMPMLGVIGYDVGYGYDSTIIDDGEPHGIEHHFIFGMPIN